MESRTAKVAWACFLGGLIGAAVALEVAEYLWWLGLLAGGLTGYFAYEFKKVVLAVPAAFRVAAAWRPDWKEVGRNMRVGFWFTLAGLAILASCLASFCPLTTYLLRTVQEPPLLLTLVMLGSFAYAAASMGTWFYIFNRIKETTADPVLRAKKVAFMMNPLALAIWWVPKAIIFTLYQTLRGLGWLIPRTPRAVWFAMLATIRFTWRFGWNLFTIVHSDLRLLCGVDAAIGVVIGYFAGSPLVGGLAGAAWGALNYEVLSKRILHLAPKPNGS